MSGTNFFDFPKERSLVKTLIVTKYFQAWAKVMMGVQDKNAQQYGNRYENRIQYLDLFAGPGQYEDGTLSTPLIVLQKAIENPKMRERLVATFNDANATHAEALEQAINHLPGIDQLKYKPSVFCSPVDEDIVKILKDRDMVPTFFFADPFGYKGLSLELLNSVLKDFGSDCIFFFNYNRVNMGLPNSKVEQPMNELFGQQRADRLRQKYKDLQPHEHELFIVEELSHAIREKIKSSRTATGMPFVLPFRFKSQDGRKTSHHLIFVSKDIRGYEIMKDIMAGESSTHEQNVASFEYNAATILQPFLFELNRPLDDLAEMLREKFAGRVMTMIEVYKAHHVDTPYVKGNYKAALNILEASKLIHVEPPANERPKRLGEITFKDTAIVTFPPKEVV